MLEVDYVVGRKEREITGAYRYATEIISRSGGIVDGRMLAYDADDYPAFAGRLPALTHYPLKVAKGKRTASIKHLCSHIQAHLLHYLDLKPCIVTCLDVYPFKRKGYPVIDRGIVEVALRGMVKAERVIAISEFTKREIISALRYPEDRIDVVHLGVETDKFRPASNEEKPALPCFSAPERRIILYVGSEQPRKNLPRLLRAVSLVKKEAGDVLFIKAGRPQWRGARKKLMRMVAELDLEENVLFLDYVPEGDLPALYSRADVFVFPSLYEGFGLPPLEAMACGCPVVVARATSLPEVVGDAGLLVNPQDEAEMAEAICRVLDDRSMASELSRRGLERAARFTWEETARKTVESYRRVAHDG